MLPRQATLSLLPVTADPERWSRLDPRERSLLGPGCTERRRHEFSAGRGCAQAAMAALGVPAEPVFWNRHGAPIWPAGTVGSISHSRTLAGAAVAPRAAIRALGIDLEADVPLSHDVRSLVLTEDDLRVNSVIPESMLSWSTLVFSAKEAVHKACYPLVHTPLEFRDTTIRIIPRRHCGNGSFTAYLRVGDEVDRTVPRQMSGTWHRDAGHFFSACWIQV